MMKLFERFFAALRMTILVSCLLLSGCGTLWDKDNTPPPSPLVPFKASVQPRQVWDARINFAANQNDMKFKPLVRGDELILVNQAGSITGLNKHTGQTLWRTQAQTMISSGIAANDRVLVVGNKNGEVFAYSAFDHRPLWKANTDSEILAAPALNSQLAIVKSINGRVSAFSTSDGRLVWRHQEVEPNLILRRSSLPQLSAHAVVVGYANGKIQKLALKDGHEIWTEAIAQPSGAFAVQRMIDLDADPVIIGDRIYAATYQGKILSLNLGNGSVYWGRDISTYNAIAADQSRVYISDAKGHIWALDQRNGHVLWKQTQLEARNLTGPAVLGSYLVVGDGEGVLHWLNKKDGRFAGRVRVSATAIATQLVASDGTVYAITKDGYLTAYQVN